MSCQLRPYKSSKISIVFVCIDSITLVERVSSNATVNSTRKRKISRFVRANFIRVLRASLKSDLPDFYYAYSPSAKKQPCQVSRPTE